MSMPKEKRNALRERIVEQIGEGTFAAGQFAKAEGLSIQTIYRYLRTMEEQGIIVRAKDGRNNMFFLPGETESLSFDLQGLQEDLVWRRYVGPFFSDLSPVPKGNLSFAFTAILNNAVEHSNGTAVQIQMARSRYCAGISIQDDGVGVFAKIAEAMGLEEKSFAILELAKGKFTTDPGSHTGEGIFFSSKVVDDFTIFSDGLVFHVGPDQAPRLSDVDAPGKGTTVAMSIKSSHREPAKDVFDRFTQAPEDYGFSKTVVPVRLLEYGDEKPLVVSRSQARRLMVRFERFSNIELDFSGVEVIGQGFADELFRVFQNQHPDTKLIPINCSEQVQKMIAHVRTKP